MTWCYSYIFSHCSLCYSSVIDNLTYIFNNWMYALFFLFFHNLNLCNDYQIVM